MSNSLISSSHSNKESSRATSVFWLVTAVAGMSCFIGWGVRGNQVLNEMKEDPIRWVSKLPLEKLSELKKYLESFPDELTPQTVLPEAETVEKAKNPQ